MNTERRQYLYLDTQMKQKSNNLDFMKFLAAWLVIVHHSFDLNVSKGEWIKVITGQQLDFGTVAVSLFFLASGLFIAKRWSGIKVPESFSGHVSGVCGRRWQRLLCCP